VSERAEGKAWKRLLEVTEAGDASEVEAYLDALDDADRIHALAQLDSEELSRILAAQSVELLAALRKLDGLKGLDPHLELVHDLEHEADGISRAAVGRLFRDGTDALDVIKWRDLYRELENAIDAAEDAAEAIEKMFHKAT